MFKFACFLLRFAPKWYLTLLIDGLHSKLERISYRILLYPDCNGFFGIAVWLTLYLTGIVPSLVFFNNAFYDNFPELRI